MPDNVAITAGTGTVIATDQIGTDHYQRVKPAWGVDGVAVDVSDVNPLPVGGVLTLSTGESHLGELGFSGSVIKLVPTISTTAYTAGDVIGGELLLTNAMRLTNQTARLKSLTMLDQDNQKAAYTLLLFDQDLTTPADNAAWAWQSADRAKLIAAISVRSGDISASGDWVTVGGTAVCTIPLADIMAVGTGIANLYLVVVIGEAKTFTTTSSLRLHIGLERN